MAHSSPLSTTHTVVRLSFSRHFRQIHHPLHWVSGHSGTTSGGSWAWAGAYAAEAASPTRAPMANSATRMPVLTLPTQLLVIELSFLWRVGKWVDLWLDHATHETRSCVPYP